MRRFIDSSTGHAGYNDDDGMVQVREHSASTYHVLLANIAVTNLIICAVLKPAAAIYLGYSYAKVSSEHLVTMFFWLKVKTIVDSVGPNVETIAFHANELIIFQILT